MEWNRYQRNAICLGQVFRKHDCRSIFHSAVLEQIYCVFIDISDATFTDHILAYSGYCFNVGKGLGGLIQPAIAYSICLRFIGFYHHSILICQRSSVLVRVRHMRCPDLVLIVPLWSINVTE